MKRALITGVTGQDGSYLAEFLLDKGYEVHGMVRRVAIEDPKHRFWRINHLLNSITIHEASLENYGSIFDVIWKVKPDECYHLAAQSYVAISFEDPFSTLNANIYGTLYLLSAIKQISPECRVYFAATSEMFGKAKETPQNEDTPFHPRSPYGISKMTGFELMRNYRESYDIFACCGILFNHESPRRGMEFVTRKITNTAAKIKLGKADKLVLGNLKAKRDWGYAPEFVEAMWGMLQQDAPDDYVIATNTSHSIKEFVKAVFDYLELDWNKYVKVDSKFFRPAEVVQLRGDYTKANKNLGWKPKVNFKELAKIMVDADLILEEN